jgi:hypothetical protein
VLWILIGRFAHATFVAAGELQAEVNPVGPGHVAESDLLRAMRRGLRLRLGPEEVPEGGVYFKLDAWPGRLGSLIWPSSTAGGDGSVLSSGSTGAAKAGSGRPPGPP